MDLHPEVRPVFRGEVNESFGKPRTTFPHFTRYEYVVLLAARSQQIAEGSAPLVSLEGLNPSDPRFLDKVVQREIEQQKLPYLVRRRLPNGECEYWSAQELKLIW
uniref:DNA-directed RNA polymerase n=1 Tax=viral metagenome TaxID=1070528 RepID=A0A6C0M0J7_9ZZZZ